MDTIAILNIALESFCIVISFIITVSIFIGENRNTKLNKIFIYMLVCNILVLMCDVTTWAVHGLEATPAVSVLVRTANFGVYSIGYVILALFTNYLVTYIGTKTNISRRIVTLIAALCAVAVGLVVLSQFNHMYYYFDEQNVYHRQGWYWLSQVWAIVLMLVNSAIVFLYRKHLDKREFWILLSYEVLPVIAMAVQIISFGLTLLYMGSTLSMVIVYIGIQTELSKRLKQKELELTESRVAVMLSQIQPHFLYNSLAAISRLCDKDPAGAKQATIEFSAYLRGNMDSLDEKGLVSFEKELRHVEGFLSLEKAMYEEALNVIYDIEAGSFFLPVLSLQPIVENAVKHGIGKREGGGSVTISTAETDDAYLVVVSDDGMGFDTDQTPGEGQEHMESTMSEGGFGSNAAVRLK